MPPQGIKLFILLTLINICFNFEVYPPPPGESQNYFVPYEKGFVGIYGDPSNLQRERINEGAFETPTEAMFYEGVFPRQVCPGMVGPFTDGNYYCTAREYGYCDRRSGACFCNMGYEGIDCSSCTPSYFKVGNICYPKKLCPDDCDFSGTCDYWTGKCKCFPHRIGPSCSEMLCSSLNPLCESCTNTTCLKCTAGYYISGTNNCSSCYDFDPRCAGCTLDDGCTLCADPLLTSVRRSGYRASDPRLPFEEDTRELSITIPFGTKSPDAFADAETYEIYATNDNPLKNHTKQCEQGIHFDDSWNCSHVISTYDVCGHYGVFAFDYPNFVVDESVRFLRMGVWRSGGGVGNVTIRYYLKHITTDDSDVVATASYTTSQILNFTAGIYVLECKMIYIR